MKNEMITCRCGKRIEREDAVLGCFCSEDCFLEAAEAAEDAVAENGPDRTGQAIYFRLPSKERK